MPRLRIQPACIRPVPGSSLPSHEDFSLVLCLGLRDQLFLSDTSLWEKKTASGGLELFFGARIFNRKGGFVANLKQASGLGSFCLSGLRLGDATRLAAYVAFRQSGAQSMPCRPSSHRKRT